MLRKMTSTFSWRIFLKVKWMMKVDLVRKNKKKIVKNKRNLKRNSDTSCKKLKSKKAYQESFFIKTKSLS
jgi:hypothetical protein